MRLIAFLFFLSSVFSGCSIGTATIQRHDKPPIEAEIIEGRQDTIVVLPDGTSELEEIPRSEIADVDHPGTFNIWLGVAEVAIGGLALYGASALLEDEWPIALIFGVPTFAFGVASLVVGTGKIGFGILEGVASNSRFNRTDGKNPPKAEPRLVVAPSLSPNGGGLSVGLSF